MRRSKFVLLPSAPALLLGLVAAAAGAGAHRTRRLPAKTRRAEAIE
jgi:hypothetical protein